jgi:hypothetical protein
MILGTGNFEDEDENENEDDKITNPRPQTPDPNSAFHWSSGLLTPNPGFCMTCV